MNLILAAAGLGDLVAVPAMAVTAAFVGQLVGVPIAWMRVRRSEAWRARTGGGRRSLRLLADFSGVPVTLSALAGGFVGLGLWIGMLAS